MTAIQPKKTFDPGISYPQNSKGCNRTELYDINRDYLFTGTSNEEPRIPPTHHQYYISNNYIQIINPRTLAIQLIHKLHAADHGQSFKSIVTNFRNGDYNKRDDIKNTPHIEFIRRELMIMSHNRFQCATCLRERLQKKYSSKNPNKGEYTEDPFKSGSIDFYGPVRVHGIGGFQYALFYMTQRGRIGFVHFCRSKNDSEILSAIQGWRLQANSAGWSLEQLHFDADPNFLSESFNESLKELGISTSISAGGQHWRSGLIERFISTIIGPSRSMLQASGLPAKFWPHAINYAVLLYNIRRNTHLLHDPKFTAMSPLEAFKNFKWHLPTPAFGQLCYASAPDRSVKDNSRFLQSSGRRSAFLGYETRDWSHPVGILLNLETGRVLRSNDFTVFKNRYGYHLKDIHGSSFGNISNLDTAGDPQTFDVEQLLPLNQVMITDTPSLTDLFHPDNMIFDFKVNLNSLFMSHVSSSTYESPSTIRANNVVSIMNVKISNKHFSSPYLRETTQEERHILYDLQPDEEKFKNECLQHVHVAKITSKVVAGNIIDIPRTYRDTLSARFRDVTVGGMTWKSASDIEIANINQHNVFSKPVTELPPNAKLVGCRMIYDAKVRKDGQLDKLKARFVILGYTQEHLLHYWETYCPTPFKESFKLLIYYAVSLGWHKYLFDVKFAFLNADMDSDNLYIEMPSYFPGYIEGLAQYLKMLKAVYGSKQASLLWHILFSGHIKNLGYVPEAADPCAFNLFDNNNQLIAKLIIHIDDMPVVAKNPAEFQRISHYFKTVASFELTESPEWNKVLGLLFSEDQDGNMIAYNDIIVDSLIKTLSLDSIKEYDTPHAPNVYYTPNIDNVASAELHNKYRTIIGSALWMALQWRYDIAFIAGHLSRFVSNPSVEHWEAALRMLGYLKRYKRLGLVYFRPPDGIVTPHHPQLLIRYDANWSGDKDCRSISAYIVSVHAPWEIEKGFNTGNFPIGNVLTAVSKRQQGFVADSTEAAETYCAVEAAKSNEWARDKLEESHAIQLRPTPMLGDNVSTTISGHNGQINNKTRHNARKTEYLKNERAKRSLDFFHIPTLSNYSNQGTKPEAPAEFKRNRECTMRAAAAV